jgi:exo-1,4-beta-D-glucosaminidase
MPAATVIARARFSSRAGRGAARVTLTNPGPAIAFFIRLAVTGRDGQEALPVLWGDNYVSLLAGETRVITASYALRDLGGAPPQLVVSGWNVRRTIAP